MSDALAPLDGTALLAGVNVVELSHHVAGAYCGSLLAKLGATVARCGPATDASVSGPALAAMQQALHGGKARVELTDPALGRLLSAADIVIAETGSPDGEFSAKVAEVAARTGIGGRSRLVVLSSGAGEAGEVRGCGLTCAAWAGMSWAIGESAREPLTLPADVPDYVMGVNAAAAALTGLLADGPLSREPISVAGRDVLAYFVGMLAPNHIAFGRPWRRAGRRTSMSGGMYPCGLFPCADGFVVLYCRRDSEWKGMLEAMGNPAWGTDPRFADPRVIATQHADAADAHLLPWLLQHSRSELIALGMTFGFAVGPVKLVSEIIAEEQFTVRGSFKTLPHPSGSQPSDSQPGIVVPSEPWRLHELPMDGGQPGGRPWPVPAGTARHPSDILKGVRVLDLSWVWSGPLVTSILSDLGAEVIKIEHPSHLDSVRLRGRPNRDGTPVLGPPTELNPWFNQLNHGKLSAIVDIKSAEGQADIRTLARSCDVVVENMRPGVLDRLSLGYADFARVNPAIVMLSMSMVGSAGPLSQMKGYAGIMSALAGLESLVGYRDGAGEERITGMMMTAFGDPNAATHAVSVLLAALYRRRKTGQGAWIDLAQTDAILSIMTSAIVEHQVQGTHVIAGNSHPVHTPHGHYRCAGDDAWVALSVQSEAQWQALARLAGTDGILTLSGSGLAERQARRTEVDLTVTAWTEKNTKEAVVARLTAAGIAAAPVATFEEMRGSAWMRHRDFVQTVRHPFIGDADVFMPPWRFGAATPGRRLPAPLLGADTDDVRRRFLTMAGAALSPL